jgi:arylamine N-acetyltransferase
MENPLARPEDTRLLTMFRERFGLPGEVTPLEELSRMATAFSSLPYENLSKIIKQDELTRPESSRRTPAEVFEDHRTNGTGGTCFSLTAALLHLVRALGFEAEPILADRWYGDNTHCALVIWIDSQPHLLDPGYLIVDPIRLPTRETMEIQTAFNRLVLQPKNNGEKIDLYTVSGGHQNHRLVFKTRPVDAGEFLRHWDSSFDWDGMRYPVLTRVHGEKQLYLQGNRFQVRSQEAVRRSEVPWEHLVGTIEREFGIRSGVVTRALEILERRGEVRGRP